MIKKINVLFFIHLFILYLAQTKPPESYSLIRGVNENINMNSGTISLDIPLFEVTEGKFKLRNNLSYESRGFVPHITPGYVGLNWSMIQFGKITREPHRIDLTTVNEINSKAALNGIRGFNILPAYSGYMNYQKYDCLTTKVDADKVSIFNHNANVEPKSYIPNSSSFYANDYISFEPDKFYFNFMGYNGYFVMDNNGKIIVYSENTSLKIDVANFGFHNIFENLNFSEIKITDDKGNQYFFGGGVETLDINYSFNNVSYESWHPEYGPWTGAANTKTNYIDSWSLKKIILNDGSEVNAYYQPVDLTILNNYRNNGGTGRELYIDSDYNRDANFPSKQNIINNNLTTELVENYTEYIHETPVPNTYLSLYTYTEVSTLTKKAILDSIKYGNINIDYKYDLTTNPLEISGKYLKEINIKRNNFLIKKVNLDYNNYGSTNQRTFLTGVRNNLGENYSMEYYNIDDFPKYIRAQSNDLGFWNGDMRNYGYAASDIGPYAIPAPDNFAAFDTGLLKKIIYPTKGNTSYIYEYGTFSKINKYNQQLGTIQLVNETGIVNSPRILKKIENDDHQNLETIYSYQNNDNSSSGILEGSEKYQVFTGSYAKSNNNLNPNLNSLNSLHYSNVKEIVNNKGFKKYTFSDRITNPDSLANKVFNLGFNNGALFDNQNKWYLSKNNERGKILKEEIFNNNGIKLKETTYKYKNFLNKLPVIDLLNSNCITCKASDLNYYIKVNRYNINYVQSMYVPVVPYLLSSQTTREYFGNNVIETVNNTNYLDKILKMYSPGSAVSEDYIWYPYPKENKETTAMGTIIKRNIYPIDLYNENACLNCINDDTKVGGQYSTYQQLHYKNIFTPVIEIIKNKANKFSLRENIFSPTASSLSGAYAVKKVRKSLLNSSFDFNSYTIPTSQTEDSSISDLYDNKLNLIQSTEKSGISTTTIWGYNQTLPLATIEGATYGEIMQAFNLNSNDNNSYLQLAIVSKSNLDIDDISESNLQSELNNFRNKAELKNFKISTYTYNPLIGVTSITPPSGIRENYKYDSSNRLEKIVDINGKIIKEYKYNYAPQKFYNDGKSQPFTRNNCGPNAVPSTYIYTVNAGQFFSLISIGDANQQAQNDIDTNGQNTANTNGTCTTISCPISWNYSIGIGGGGSVSVIPNSYFKVSFGFGTGSNSTNLPWATGVKIATINGSCRPVSDFSSYNGQIYYTVKTNGDIILKTQGSIPPNNTSYNYEIVFPIN